MLVTEKVTGLNLEADPLMPMAQAARLLPSARGKHPHVATLRRWALNGWGKGRQIKLRAVLVAGVGLCTTKAWLEEFLAVMTARRRGELTDKLLVDPDRSDVEARGMAAAERLRRDRERLFPRSRRNG